jgi:putative DNA primase/helicase
MTTPATAQTIDAALPAWTELFSVPQWVVWRYETRDGTRTKLPLSPHGGMASSTDPATWASATLAEAERLRLGADGIGFVVSSDDPYVGIDLDHAITSDGLTSDAAHIVALLNSYTEHTPSGTGLRVWVKGRWTSDRHRVGTVEVYDGARFFTFTARHLDATPTEIHERQEQLDTLRTAYFPDPAPVPSHSTDAASPAVVDDVQLVTRAMKAKNGEKFSALWNGDTSGYPSQSEAELALCNHLRFWTGSDPVRMDALFRQSGLYREKWDTRHGAQTYGQMTVAKALSSTVRPDVRPDVRPSPNGGASTLPNGTSTAVLVDLETVVRKPIRWLWPGYIPLGKVSVWDGDPGLGKGTVSLDIAARVTTGRAMPDGTPGLDRPRGVVFLSPEDDPADTIGPRFDLAGGDDARFVLLTGVVHHGELSLPTVEDLGPIEEAIDRVDAAVVTIDPVMAHIPDARDAHKDQAVRRALAPLAVLAARKSVAVILVRHLNKTAGGNALYRGGGSIGIIGLSRAGCLFGVDPTDPTKARRVMIPHKHNLSGLASPYAFTIIVKDVPGLGPVSKIRWDGPCDVSTTDLLDQPVTAAEQSDLDDAMAFLGEILAFGPEWRRAIRKEAQERDISTATLRRAKSKLGIKADRAVHRGPWFWHLPSQKGRHPANPVPPEEEA